MEDIESNVLEAIDAVRTAIEESQDIKNKKKLENKLIYVEGALQCLLNYAYAENDNLEDLKDDLLGL